MATAFCENCGTELKPSAKFCGSCGQPQPEDDGAPTAVEETAEAPATEEPTVQAPVADPAPKKDPPPKPERPAAEALKEKADRAAPGAGELASQLGTQLSTPGAMVTFAGGGAAAFACLVFGLVLSVITPQFSLLNAGDDGILKEALTHASGFMGAGFEVDGDFEGQLPIPLLGFILIPILGAAAGVAATAPGTREMSTAARMGWAAGAGVPLAFLMLVISLAAGESELPLIESEISPLAGGAFALALLWGAVGGLLGMWFAIRSEGASLVAGLPAGAAKTLTFLGVVLRPLGAAIAIMAVIGTAVWVVQTIRLGEEIRFEDSREERGTPLAVGEQVAYAADHGVHWLAFGSGASFEVGLNAPFPLSFEDQAELVDDEDFDPDDPPTFSIFSYGGAVSPAIFIPMLIILIGIPALLALYAGFSAARTQGAVTPQTGAVWGSLVGVVWAVAMAILAALANDFVANPSEDTVFVAMLLGGSLLGALGGLLGAQGHRDPAGT